MTNPRVGNFISWVILLGLLALLLYNMIRHRSLLPSDGPPEYPHPKRVDPRF